MIIFVRSDMHEGSALIPPYFCITHAFIWRLVLNREELTRYGCFICSVGMLGVCLSRGACLIFTGSGATGRWCGWVFCGSFLWR